LVPPLLGITNWKSATSVTKRIEHGDGNRLYIVISGTVEVPYNSDVTVPSDQFIMVSIVVPKLENNIAVKARMTHTMALLSAISYSKPMPLALAKDLKEATENEAIDVSF
jgi:hypothetical protein